MHTHTERKNARASRSVATGVSAKPWWPDGAPADARSRGSAYVGTPCFLCSGSGPVVYHKAGEDCPREWKRTPRGEG